MNMPLINIEIRVEYDIVLVRQRARQIAALLGFAQLDQTRVATATSEIARNSVQYAGGGRVEFSVESGTMPAFVIRFLERGPGIKDLQKIVAGEYISETGLGLGISGAKRLMDRFTVESLPGAGASTLMAKILPKRTVALTPQELGKISAELAKKPPEGLLTEIQQQNQELLSTLQELRESQAELAQMHSRELDETNRGVLALYAELDEGAKSLQRLSDLKSRFLSEMSHELRSPLNSIKGLTGFLLGRSDGDLTAEQEKQVKFIRQAADALSTLVDDVLDVARVEAGKALIRSGLFEVQALFEGLDGTIRPMIAHAGVILVFDEPIGVTTLESDEGKVAQILRNFLTNAVKFTEQGEIRVSARPGPDDTIVFSVKDTGIGIAASDLKRIFEDYGQIESPLQKRVKGIGLGLPLTQKLARLLGGTVSIESEPGVGSTFSAVIPRKCRPDGEHESQTAAAPAIDATRTPPASLINHHDPSPEARGPSKKALIVDDRERDRYLIREALGALGQFEIAETDRGEEVVSLARSMKPDVIFLDLILPDITGFEILEQLKSDAETKDIPVVINTSRTLDENERGRLIAKTAAILAKGKESHDEVITDVRESLMRAGVYPPVP
jgi:signal transduction histidine kinase